EAIKYELLKIAYGIFDWLKNDPSQREKNKNLTLEWVGTIPGKRESRRFIGDHILTQQDVVERKEFPDAVAYGGWNLDDHAPLGFFDDVAPPSTHTQIPGLYNIPLRSLYSKSVDNLLFAGRNVSATHIALTSVRVMLTCAQMGEAAGAAATLAVQKDTTPRAIASGELMSELRERLLRDDHYIVGARSQDASNLCLGAAVKASSTLTNLSFERSDCAFEMDKDRMILFPTFKGSLPQIEVLVSAKEHTTLGWQLHRTDGRGLTIPHRVIAEGAVQVKSGGTQWVRIPVNSRIDSDDWSLLEIKKNPSLQWLGCKERRVGMKSFVEAGAHRGRNSNHYSRFQILRGEQNYCIRLPEEPRAYAAENVINGSPRPHQTPNLWISNTMKFEPEWLEIAFGKTAAVRELRFLFDSDLDRHLTNTWVNAPYPVEPDLVKDYDIELRRDGVWTKVLEIRDNHHRRRAHSLATPVNADALRLVVRATNGTPRAQVYDVSAWS
ncbi:MAG TPA: FAD-dependent oxidoreductase, partial [Planctomycetota bacterium]|nr:FAD-dependent oxidoreductase [Planctomycetota bacterium]